MGRGKLALTALVFALAACGGDDSSNRPPTGTPSNPAPTPTPTPVPTPSPTPVTLTYLHVFAVEPGDGSQPNGPLLQASDGNFYGTTRAGGTHACRPPDDIPCGTVFKMTPSGETTVLHSFGASPIDGYSPTAHLIQGNDGALYGTTTNGGAYGGGGTIFRITLAGDYTVLHSFGATPTDGVVPNGGLVQASDGNFYGATASGGANHCLVIPQAGGNCGTIFRMALDGETTILYSFGSSPTDGVQPNGSLIEGSDGNFYGTTSSGGANLCGSLNTHICGTVFKITPTGVVTILHSFGTSPADGMAPQGALVQGSDGAFYGTTASGGRGRCGSLYGCGTVFRITSAGEVAILYEFALDSRLDGYGPSPFLIQAEDGNFYGTTGSGGANQGDLNGTVFRLTPSGVKTILYSFGPVNEEPHNPLGGVIQAADGAFYGVTGYNGTLGWVGARPGFGTAFKLEVP